jgi:purine catabolism regulator
MAYLLSDAMRDPRLAAMLPVVAAGHAAAERAVIRWAHTSEQLDIAPLLLGGELLLMEGALLSTDQDPAECREYVRSLVDAGVGALALELSPRLPAVPPPIVAAADELGLPVLALPRRVPFVQVCESINTHLTEQKFRSIRLADRVSGLLADAASGDAGVDELLQVVASATGASASLVSLTGDEIARASPGPGVDTEPTAGTFSNVLHAGDSLLGTLHLRAHADADLHAVAVALDRAPDVLAIAVLRHRPPSVTERLTAQLFAIASVERADQAADLQIDAFLGRLGAGSRERYLGVRADTGHDDRRLRALLRLLTGAGADPGPVLCVVGSELLALLPFATAAAMEEGRAELLRLGAALDSDALLCVGSGLGGQERVPRELAEVRGAREWAPAGGVVDSRQYRLERFASSLQDDPEADDLVEEVLGPLRAQRGELLATLEAFASLWGSKTATAAALGIGRQTLYDRLARIEELIGPLDSSPARARVVMTAVFLHRARAALPAGSPPVGRTFPPPAER